jgi:hypothetical protein
MAREHGVDDYYGFSAYRIAKRFWREAWVEKSALALLCPQLLRFFYPHRR